MTWGEVKKQLDEELEDDDVIDLLSILDRVNNRLCIEKTSRGYHIEAYYEPINYKHLNDPNRED